MSVSCCCPWLCLTIGPAQADDVGWFLMVFQLLCNILVAEKIKPNYRKL